MFHSVSDGRTPEIKHTPYGYFRSFSYQPMLAYPPFYPPNYYNPFMPWQNDINSRISSYPYGNVPPAFVTPKNHMDFGE